MITSSANPTIKEIRSLRNKKSRDESGMYYIEGTRIVLEAIEENENIRTLIWCPSSQNSDMDIKAVRMADQNKIKILEVSELVFKSISLKEGSQRISAVVEQKWTDFTFVDQKLAGLWVGLYEIADPGNLGTIMRTMDAVGVKGLFLIGNCTDPHDPSAVRASMGAIFSKSLVKVSKMRFEKWLTDTDTEIIGTCDQAQTSFRDIQYPKDGMLLMGSEREGLPESIMKHLSKMVRIPMLGKNDSLNLAVATSVILYEVQRQFMNTLGQK